MKSPGLPTTAPASAVHRVGVHRQRGQHAPPADWAEAERDHTGHHHEAIEHYGQALDLRRALGNTDQAADTLDNLAHPHAALGRHAQARALWREALEFYRKQGRDADADRVQRSLDGLDHRHGNADRPPHRVETAR